MTLRTLLVLGRVSNLPTVWSNLLAACVLVPMEYRSPDLFAILIGGSCIYIGGMFLNDYCDAAFDAQFCPKRPIPAGRMPRAEVGLFAVLWFCVGLTSLAVEDLAALPVTLGLIVAVILYDFHHKNVWWAPLLMGLCRFLLYPLAATTFANRETWPNPVDWTEVYLMATGLGLYVAGITYVARGESRPGKPTRWALVLLLAPLAAAAINSTQLPAGRGWLLIAAVMQLAWMAWLLVPLWRGTKRSIGRLVSGLLAGIVLVDLMTVAPHLQATSAWLLIFFVLALLLQRFVPAT